MPPDPSPQRIQRSPDIDTGDHVFHKPSRETWLVRRVHGDRLYPCGWPSSCAALSDCRLVYKATNYERNCLKVELYAKSERFNAPLSPVSAREGTDG